MGDGILTKFKLIHALIAVLIVYKNEEDPFKIESTRVVTTFSHYKSMGIFLNSQGQVTHKSLIGSCWISNPSELLWVNLLPARMKKMQSKMKELEWSQHYSFIFLTLKGS